ncbi:peptidyl-prolyl cis-trans isomerase-like [Neltuma alba]|uniref:peptidyl-prolyl cis-trans isomerase-like n=1 Tax=Neltuma alba TaxID=207710 RepID=UPI0010A4655C|nr:peptidyl-prolyl cis-trans isomerase-like [Prosopis alba]
MTEEEKLPVFMDVFIAGMYYERMVFELFYDIAPYTAEDFRALCTGEKGVSPNDTFLCYANCFFHKVKKGGSYVKGGAINYETGEDVQSVFGPYFFDDGSNNLKHDKEGLLSMPRRDFRDCRSHFLITLRADESLDRTHVVTGKLVEGMDTLREIGQTSFDWAVRIVDCGMLYNARDIPPGVIIRPLPRGKRDGVSSKGRERREGRRKRIKNDDRDDSKGKERREGRRRRIKGDGRDDY